MISDCRQSSPRELPGVQSIREFEREIGICLAVPIQERKDTRKLKIVGDVENQSIFRPSRTANQGIMTPNTKSNCLLFSLKTLPQFWLTHPIWFYHPSPFQSIGIRSHNNLALLLRLFLPNSQISKHTPDPLVPGVNLQPSHVRIFSILMIFHDFDLHQEGSESLAVLATSNVI
jgi:hypothetical protein